MTDVHSPTEEGARVRAEQLLERLSRALIREPRPEIVVRAALDALVSEVGAASAALYFADVEAGTSRPIYTVNYPEDVLQRVREVPHSIPAISNIALATGDVIYVTDTADAPANVPFSVELADRMGVRAFAAVPLMSTGRTIGTLVYNLAEVHVFTAGEIQLLREVGDRIAAALERAMLEEELTRRVEEAELLSAIATAVAGEDNLQRMLSTTLKHLATVLKFTGGSIAVIDGDDLIIESAIGPQSEQIRGQHLHRGSGREWAIIDSGEPFLCGNLAARPGPDFRSHAARDVRSCLVVPLIWRGESLGLLQIESQEENSFHASSLSLVAAVGALLGGPIELARRYQMEVRLRRDLDEARGRLAAIIAHAPMGVVFFDRDARLAYINQAVGRLLHVPTPDAFSLGESWTGLATRLTQRRWVADPATLFAMIEQCRNLRDGMQVNSLALANPEQILLHIAAPVFESGAFSGHVVIMIDVTAERRALEDAEQAIALRDRFISIASHELKTPLTSIKGTAQLILRFNDAGVLDRDLVRKHITTIGAQADRIRLLIDEMLDVSRIQMGRIELRPELLDLGDLVANVIGALPEEQQARIHADISGPVPGTWDALRIEQVTLNLLDNALKYSAATSTVHVRVERAHGAAILTVRDTGIGIAEADLPHIFEPFVRASNASDYDHGGLGMGLFITRQLVELHGGTIEIDSIAAHGTEFRVQLPSMRPPQATA